MQDKEHNLKCKLIVLLAKHICNKSEDYLIRANFNLIDSYFEKEYKSDILCSLMTHMSNKQLMKEILIFHNSSKNSFSFRRLYILWHICENNLAIDDPKNIFNPNLWVVKYVKLAKALNHKYGLDIIDIVDGFYRKYSPKNENDPLKHANFKFGLELCGYILEKYSPVFLNFKKNDEPYYIGWESFISIVKFHSLRKDNNVTFSAIDKVRDRVIALPPEITEKIYRDYVGIGSIKYGSYPKNIKLKHAYIGKCSIL
ncbi:MAG: hypothetical protein J0G32_01220 [Alphaproteobacteria bacterium]|nr:hypothetical protein [Alphaproteobacteria bacterium]OJV15275.1 MAG: hypothetical protein BGO27_02065 [Alphaproteobacteria bacterium 33-17]